MPEKSHKRKLGLRSDPSSSQTDVETTRSSYEESIHLSEQDFEDISNKIENKISKGFRDAEFGQREILKLFENLFYKVGNWSITSSEQGCSTARIEHIDNVPEEIQEVNSSKNIDSNHYHNKSC